MVLGVNPPPARMVQANYYLHLCNYPSPDTNSRSYVLYIFDGVSYNNAEDQGITSIEIVITTLELTPGDPLTEAPSRVKIRRTRQGRRIPGNSTY